ncbi:hypothetical protein Tco_1285655 [Tanacetum coccineum]
MALCYLLAFALSFSPPDILQRPPPTINVLLGPSYLDVILTHPWVFFGDSFVMCCESVAECNHKEIVVYIISPVMKKMKWPNFIVDDEVKDVYNVQSRSKKPKVKNEFEPIVNSEKYLTKEDDNIRKTDILERMQVRQREAVVRPAGGSHSRMHRRNTSTASTSNAPQTVVGSVWTDDCFMS